MTPLYSGSGPERVAHRLTVLAMAVVILVPLGVLASGVLRVVLFALAGVTLVVAAAIVWPNWPGHAALRGSAEAWRERRYGKLIPRQGSGPHGRFWECPYCGRRVLNMEICPGCNATNTGERAERAAK